MKTSSLALAAITLVLGCAPDLVPDEDGGGNGTGGNGTGASGASGGNGTGAGGSGGQATGAGDTGGAASGGAASGGSGGGLAGGGSGGGTPTPVCGNGVIEAGEPCDDGNASDGDACTTMCEAQEVLAVTNGQYHACALLTGGAVKCWGHNDRGQLGVGDFDDRGDAAGEMGGDLPAVDLGGVPAVEISAGVLHTCALLANNTVRCWGNASIGELGTGDVLTRTSPGPVVQLGAGLVVEHISAGSGHTCALFTDGTAKCWGFGIHGELGNGGTVTLGDEPNEMGDALPFVDISEPIERIFAGNYHNCVIVSGGGVRCWGYNGHGELGLGDTSSRPTPPAADLPLGEVAVDLGAGSESSCALLVSGNFKCWGWGDNGSLGTGSLADVGDQPGEVAALSGVSLGGFPDLFAVQLNGGCANVINQGVKCWGENSAGVSGQSHQADYGDNPNEMGANLPVLDLGSGLTAMALADRGLAFECALLDDHSLKCWGYNGFGQLGLGNVEARGDNAGEMGDNLPRVRLFNDAW